MAKIKRSTNRDNRRGQKLRASNHLSLVSDVTFDQRISTKPRKISPTPLNDAQRRYDAAIRSSQVVFGVGPAGTGKTWLAAMRAAEALDSKTIERIVVTRPAVEAGESLGFLPGELDEKYEPYFRPVRDALEEWFGSSHLEYLIKSGKIEARPLALIRGSTLKNCWVLADEMQNATRSQFMMLLSRIGENAKFILNGDPRQTDLPRGTSGLDDAQRRLINIDDITVVNFTTADIVRSGICQEIVEAYERD